MKTYKRIVVVMLALALILPAVTVNAQGARSAAITFTTVALNPIPLGNEITFDLILSVENINPGVAGADVYLSYNPALVVPPTSPDVAVVEVLPDFFGISNVSVNEVLPAAQCPGGASPCVHLVLAGSPQITQSGVAARYHFLAVMEGYACFSVLQSSLVDANGFQVAHVKGQDPCGNVQVCATTNGVVQRQGVPANPNTGGGNLSCSSVTASGAGNFGPVDTTVNGKFTLTNMLTGTYTIRAIYPGYLASEKRGVLVAGNSYVVDVGTTTLRGGDVNGDNAINILDIGTIISKFGKTGFAVKSASVNCSGSDESTDINDDSLINISDLAIAAGNWGRTGPTPWLP